MEKGGVSALERPAAELTVVDVYDIAALLGHEFEVVIERHGCEAVVGVVPKVVRVLELLESLVNYGGARHQAEELQGELDRLRQERDDRLEHERKHQTELEMVEDVWRSEVQDLLSQISALQKDNKKLLLSQSVFDPDHEDQETEGVSEKEKEVLRELVDRQREDIRTKEHELTMRSRDIEALQQQQSRLMKMNQDLRHRLALLEAQGRALVQTRAELEALAQGRLQELGSLRQEVSRLQRELQDIELDRGEQQVHISSGLSAGGGSPISVASPRFPDSEEKASSVWLECAGDPEFLANCFEKTAGCGKDEPALLLLDSSGEAEDSSDGRDSPRFTLQELRDVLYERNQLKAQVFLLQEELAYYNTEESEEDSLCVYSSSPEEGATATAPAEPESRIRSLFFTAIMPMVAAGLISDDPTLMPIRRLVSIV